MEMQRGLIPQLLATVQPAERRAVGWSFGYFFSLLCGYYILRPVRDEMGILGGVDQLQWLFTGTLIAMLCAVPIYGWLVGRYQRRTFLPAVYLFFAANLLIFYLLLKSTTDPAWVARAFFIWTSVYNLFAVSVFWSVMADLFRPEQGRRLFGLIAAGGSAGAIAGPLLTATLATRVGTANLLLISIAFLGLTLLCVQQLGKGIRQSNAPNPPAEPRIGGSPLAGLSAVARSAYLLQICGYVLLLTTLATFLYFMQAQIIADAFESSAQRTAVFARVDLAVNMLTVSVQIFFTGRLMNRFGVQPALVFLPLLCVVGFSLLGVMPGLAVLLGFQILRRAGNYALTRPAREVLFTVVPREEKYKAKSFIDTVIYRAGDAVSAWVFAGLKAGGLSLAGTALVALPLCLIWWLLGAWLGRDINRRASAVQEAPHETT